jgi:hypothetical protein
LNIEGSQLFDPSGEKRPMREWVQVSALHSNQWKKNTEAAYKYVEKYDR